MTVQMLKGKIHRATVKQAELNYVGSITVDADLLDAAGIYEYEKVAIVDIENGSRFETYTIAGERGSGMICLNGAAARCVSVGDKVILMAYAQLTPGGGQVRLCSAGLCSWMRKIRSSAPPPMRSMVCSRIWRNEKGEPGWVLLFH